MMEGIPDEIEARRILAEHRYERGIDDDRTCVEIVIARKLLPQIEPIVEPSAVDEVE